MIHLIPESEKTLSGAPRPLKFEIQDKSQLYSFYISVLKYGGLFIPKKVGEALLPIGAKTLILLTLPDDSNKKTVTGKVCWATPPNAALGVSYGFGVAFDDNETNRLVKAQIENQLAGILGKSDVRTQTI